MRPDWGNIAQSFIIFSLCSPSPSPDTTAETKARASQEQEKEEGEGEAPEVLVEI